MARLRQVTHEQLERDAKQFLKNFFVEPGLALVRTGFDNPFIQLLWREHYVGSKGTIGRQLHYIIYLNGEAVGGISAGSAMFAHKKRDRILAVTSDERRAGLRHIVNNTMFRLTRPKEAPPKATDVLRLFRRVVEDDWMSEYGDFVRAFETLVEPPRWGGIYKLDGWRKIGSTAGLGARRPEGHGTVGKNSTGVRKIIRVPKKIVWVRPICTYEEAVERSAESRRTSYGEDAASISAYFQDNGQPWVSSRAIAAATNISLSRVCTLLYLLVNADRTIERNESGLYRLRSRSTPERVVRIYSQQRQQRLEL